MPIHDWTRVDAGTFHAFHTRWMSELMGALNSGVLPEGYYAMAEQVASRTHPDVLALSTVPPDANGSSGGVAVAETAPRVLASIRPNPGRPPRRSPQQRRRHLAIRHVSGDRIVAMMEIVSPSTKDRRRSVRDFAEKVVGALEAGIHMLMLDLFPPGPADPQGLHGAVWSYFDRAGYPVEPGTPLMLASYAWDGEQPEAYLQPSAAGDVLVPMPLFLTHERYVNVPLEETYQSAYRGMPARWRSVLEAPLSDS